MKHDLILNKANYTKDMCRFVGGKAANLFFLEKKDIPVPSFFCLSSAAMDTLFPEFSKRIIDILGKVRFDEASHVSEISKKIQNLIENLRFPSWFLDEINTSLNQFDNNTFFSVRSSGTLEDGARYSFAGQFKTWLNIAPHDVAAKIKSCWAGAFSPELLMYMNQSNLNLSDIPIAVIVQEMIQAKQSGVLFQADPKGDISKELIAAGFGLGEGIVAGKVESDLYVYDKRKGTWALEINQKTCGIRTLAEGDCEEYKIPISQGNEEVLDESKRNVLISESRKIAKLYSHFQDIEWSFDQKGSLKILQSRPITTIPKGDRRIFDNSNIAESYPHIVLPMTFSILQLDYYHCIKKSLSLFGVPRTVIRKYEPVLKNLVGYLDGRAYYNLENWYQLILLVPFGKRKLIKAFNEMIGTHGVSGLQATAPKLSTFEKSQIAVFFPFKILFHAFGHKETIRQYFRETKGLKKTFEAIPQNIPSDNLIGHFIAMTQQFMEQLAKPIVNDFLAMVFMATSKGLLKLTGEENPENKINALLGGQNIASTKPVEKLEELILQIKQSPSLLSYLKNFLNKKRFSSKELIDSLIREDYVTFAKNVKIYLEVFGHRSPKELVMEADTYKENPQALVLLLIQKTSMDKKQAREQSPIESEKFKEKWIRLKRFHIRSILKYFVFKLLFPVSLRQTRRAVAYREATRLDRGLHFSFFRTMLHRLGRALVQEGFLEKPRDIFYLTRSDLDGFRHGNSPNSDLMGLVRYRKSAKNKWSKEELPEMVFASGSVHANRFPAKESTFETEFDQQKLLGTGCSTGEVTLEAIVVEDPSQVADVRGKILVSKTTDPGWVFLMTMSGGLISERGSLLSHTAIIGRELGIPTIVGIKGATQKISTGQKITMNGKTGEVQLHPVVSNPIQSDVTPEVLNAKK